MLDRFGSLLENFGIRAGSQRKKDLGFENDVFAMAAAMDRTYAFRWLNDHSGTEQDKELRQHVIGNTRTHQEMR